MSMEIFKEFTFEAAHRLPKLPPEHKCSRLHGHSYRVEVWLRGSIDSEKGWLVDFGDVKNAFKSTFDLLDHSYLNEVEGLHNPTAENLAQWIWKRIYPSFPNHLSKIVVRETCTAGTVYAGTSLG